MRIRHSKGTNPTGTLRPMYGVWFERRCITVQLGWHMFDIWYR